MVKIYYLKLKPEINYINFFNKLNILSFQKYFYIIYEEY